MDEGTLNDLLECSVCLERLDTSSKVLPCQHTFCRKCLEEIVERHKELRCPECRVLVNSKVEELPPNVLLMRILEGMRNAAPKRSAGRNKGNHHSVPVSPAYHNMQGAVVERKGDGNKQQAVVMPHQPYAKALYDYTSNAVGELSFKTGDTIVLKKRIDNHWYQGECGGRQGAFPLCYVQVITPVPSHTPQCKALYDFRMTNDEEEGCLAFNKGDVISVIRRVDENWAEGKLNGKIGIFPLAFVELNSLARSLMKLSKNSQPGPSRIAPPTPTAEDSAPLIPTDHTRNVANIQVTQPLFDSTVSSGGSSATTTPNTSSSTNSSGSSTAPSSPASPPPRNQPIPLRNAVQKEQTGTPQRAPPPRPEVQPENHHRHHHREKRHSFTLAMPHQSPSTHRHSAEIFGGTDGEGHSAHRSHESGRKNGGAGGDGSCPLAYIALYPYKPQKPDELELRKGGIYMVTERCQDGWFKGISNRTQKCGVFPGNYVTLARGGPQPSTTQGAATEKAASSSNSRSAKNLTSQKQASSCVPPELPPRSTSPNVTPSTISTSWHGQQETSTIPIGRSSSAVIDITNGQATSVATKLSDKSKERREKGGGTVSLMRRLTSMKRSKSPPPSSYSMDNPVFEDTSVSLPSNAVVHPVHIRSGSCPSQLLQLQPNEQHHRLFSSASQRLKHKERPTILTHSSRVDQQGTAAVPDVHHHRKSNSLDAGSRPTKTGSQTVRERFRCIAPYPPNSEYELELQVNDIIYVHKKRDDGWYKGTQQRTGRTGLFPASFVESF